MHFLGLLTFDKDKADTPQEAMEFATKVLHNEGFVSNDGHRWSTGSNADWLVMGGRWNGHISFLRAVSDDKVKAFICTLKMLYQKKEGDIDIRKINEHLKKSFPNIDLVKYGGIYKRNTAGGEDNAQIVDDVIYNNMLKEHEGLYQDDNGEHFWDYEYKNVSRADYIGKKWIVVFDYHM